MFLQPLVGAIASERHSDFRPHSASELSSDQWCGLSSIHPIVASTREGAILGRDGTRTATGGSPWDKAWHGTIRTGMRQSDLQFHNFPTGVFERMRRRRIFFQSATPTTSSAVSNYHSPGAGYVAQPHQNLRLAHNHYSLSCSRACFRGEQTCFGLWPVASRLPNAPSYASGAVGQGNVRIQAGKMRSV